MTTEFSAVLAAIERAGPDSLRASVPADWLQGRTVFGGMQMALAARAMRLSMPDDIRALPLRSAQMTFVGPVAGNEPIELRAALLRRGKSTVHARCDLVQAGAVGASAVAVFGVSRPSRFVRELPPPAPDKGPDDTSLPSLDKGFAPAFTRHFEARWAYGNVPFSGFPEPRSLIYGRLRDRECGAEDALLALADLIPTPVLSMLHEPAPASSLSWMIEVLRDPAQLDLHGWCLIDTHVRAGTDGYLSQTSVLHGPDGHAYAVSHQTVGVFG
jgi:acyl-CoA thioesterase